MKILCVCKEGNVRSTAMAYVLKTLGHEAIAVGWHTASRETLVFMSDWADATFAAESDCIDNLQFINQNNLINVDIGPDQWGFDMIKILIQEARPKIYEALTKIRI